MPLGATNNTNIERKTDNLDKQKQVVFLRLQAYDIVGTVKGGADILSVVSSVSKLKLLLRSVYNNCPFPLRCISLPQLIGLKKLSEFGRTRTVDQFCNSTVTNHLSFKTTNRI